MITRWLAVTGHLAIARWRRLADARDDGSTLENTVLIALLVALALTVGAILTAKVVAKAKSIDLGP